MVYKPTYNWGAPSCSYVSLPEGQRVSNSMNHCVSTFFPSRKHHTQELEQVPLECYIGHAISAYKSQVGMLKQVKDIPAVQAGTQSCGMLTARPGIFSK